MLAELHREMNAVSESDELHASVIATRMRISRNLREPFVQQLSGRERCSLRERIFADLGQCEGLAGARYFALDSLGPHEREFLTELLQGETGTRADPAGCGLVLSQDPRQSILVGEEDHLRLHCLREGLQIQQAYACADSLDAILEERFVFAFSEEFGYLGPSPWRCGTGLKASIIVHLPALALSEELPRIFRALSALHFSVSALRSEEPPGNSAWAEIANTRCLGDAESVYLEQLGKMAGKLDNFERRARERLLSEAQSLLEDRVWSAYGQLRYGRLMGEDRARELLGILRLGCLTEIIQDVSLPEIRDVSQRIRDGHLQLDAPLDEKEREGRRAKIIRDWLDRDGTGKDK